MFVKREQVGIARDNVVGMAFTGAGQHRVVRGVGLDHLHVHGARGDLCLLDQQTKQRFFLFPGETDEGTKLGIGKDSPELGKQRW